MLQTRWYDTDTLMQFWSSIVELLVSCLCGNTLELSVTSVVWQTALEPNDSFVLSGMLHTHSPSTQKISHCTKDLQPETTEPLISHTTPSDAMPKWFPF